MQARRRASTQPTNTRAHHPTPHRLQRHTMQQRLLLLTCLVLAAVTLGGATAASTENGGLSSPNPTSPSPSPAAEAASPSHALTVPAGVLNTAGDTCFVLVATPSQGLICSSRRNQPCKPPQDDCTMICNRGAWVLRQEIGGVGSFKVSQALLCCLHKRKGSRLTATSSQLPSSGLTLQSHLLHSACLSTTCTQ